ncbi:MAG: aminoglycoside phosphotransferase family protein [Jhaorihella sp.]
MTERETQLRAFLDRSGWAGADRAALAGDASNRRYERLSDPATRQTAVLMDAPADKGEDVGPFVEIARFLRATGLSAPEILAQDRQAGFLILEDLGDDLFARVLAVRPGLETQLYETATDVLVVLHRATPPSLAEYSPALMTGLAALALSKYRDGIRGTPDLAALSRFEDRFGAILRETVAQAPPVLIQRDYHAENLLWLPRRSGVARVGLLDFQDAMLGHPAYDLVSLLQDARRDVTPGIETAMIARYLAATRLDPDAFAAAYAVLGAQRNLRILGVFARLATEYGKPHYLGLVPRVWAHLERDLDHPALATVAGLLRDALPEPTHANLSALQVA